MDTVFCRDQQVDLINPRILFLGTDTVDIGTCRCNDVGQLCQHTLMIHDFHLNTGFEFLFTEMLHIPLYWLIFIRFTVITTDVRTAFLMHNQPLARADMGNDGITGDWAAAFGKADQHSRCTPDR